MYLAVIVAAAGGGEQCDGSRQQWPVCSGRQSVTGEKAKCIRVQLSVCGISYCKAMSIVYIFGEASFGAGIGVPAAVARWALASVFRPASL